MGSRIKDQRSEGLEPQRGFDLSSTFEALALGKEWGRKKGEAKEDTLDVGSFGGKGKPFFSPARIVY